MKINNLKKLILTIIPVLFIFAINNAKADTFSYMDLATYAAGGAGYNCGTPYCRPTWLLQMDKQYYDVGDTAYFNYCQYDLSGVCTNTISDQLLTIQTPNQIQPNGSNLLERHFSGNSTNPWNSFLIESGWETNYSNPLTIYTNPFGPVEIENGSYVGPVVPNGFYVQNFNGSNYDPDTQTPAFYPFTSALINPSSGGNLPPFIFVR